MKKNPASPRHAKPAQPRSKEQGHLAQCQITSDLAQLGYVVFIAQEPNRLLTMSEECEAVWHGSGTFRHETLRSRLKQDSNEAVAKRQGMSRS